jgi:putative transposase
MLERFPDCRPLADIFGKFDEIVVDNGWEFTGTSFESAMTDVGTSVRWAPVRSPTHKAIVERFFGTLNERLNKRLPGGTFPVALMRAWGLDPRKEAVLTLEQAEDLIEHAIGVYHQDIHSSLGEPPVAAWTRGVRAQGIQVIGDDLQLDKMIGAEVDRKLTRSGISLFGLDYHDPAVTGPLLEELAALEPMRSRRKGSATAKVKVKYNPADISRVHVWNHRRGIFDTLPCVDAEYAEGLTKWQHERIQEWQRETQSETEEERRELRCALRDKINALSSAKRINRLQRNQVRLLSSPMIQQLAGDHLRLEFAEPRHDGMAPVIATVPLASERTDGHAKPTRPARGGKRKAPANPPRSISSEPDTGTFANFENSADDWEEFQ